MEGQGVIENEDLTVDKRFKVFQAKDCPNLGRVKETWYTAVPPNCHCYSNLSPADQFGKVMAESINNDITVGIINVAVGGCDIRLFDKDIYQDHDSTFEESWFLDKVASYNGSPYHYLINLAQLAQQDGVIKGILLHQGETNTGNQDWPNYVQKIYSDMLTDLSLSAADVPLLAGEMLSESGNCCSSMNPIINQLPNVIPTAHIISSEGCTGADNAHFDSEGYRLLGTRYAEKMLSLLEQDLSSAFKEIPSDLFSFKVFPNPVDLNNLINIRFSLPQKEFVSVKLYDQLGAEITEIIGKEIASGTHTLKHNVPKLPAGTYYYKLRINGSITTRSVLIQ